VVKASSHGNGDIVVMFSGTINYIASCVVSAVVQDCEICDTNHTCSVTSVYGTASSTFHIELQFNPK
jgi:hypothetical protein